MQQNGYFTASNLAKIIIQPVLVFPFKKSQKVMVVTLKWCIFDPMVVKPKKHFKCGSFSHFSHFFQLFVNTFSNTFWLYQLGVKYAMF